MKISPTDAGGLFSLLVIVIGGIPQVQSFAAGKRNRRLWSADAARKCRSHETEPMPDIDSEVVNGKLEQWTGWTTSSKNAVR